MAPSRLLRYIFRHGPHSPHKTHPPAPLTPPAPLESVASSIDTGEIAQASATTEALPGTPDRLITPIFEDTVEESPRSLTTTVASADIGPNIHSLSTRELLYAAIEEARCAMHAHLDTIHTALLVLEALNGFSETIKLVKEEMTEKKTVCEEKLAMLDDVETAVAHMDGDMEESDEDATLRSRYT